MSSRKEEKEQRRAERLERERQDQEQARRRRMYSIVVGGALGLAAIAAVVVAVAAGGGDGGGSAGGVPTGASTFEGAVNPPPQQQTDLDAAAKAAGATLKNPVIEGRTHIDEGTKVVYKTNPPTSGNHDPQPAGDGVYDKTFSALDTRHFVHTLEHGRIEVQYDPSLPKRRIDQLGGLFNEDPYHMILMPNRRMPYQVAATAWGHLIGFDKITDETFDALRAFRDRYRDQGPEQAA
jgi:uncharacterized protein DUF3105